jgi:hypothetical protein
MSRLHTFHFSLPVLAVSALAVSALQGCLGLGSDDEGKGVKVRAQLLRAEVKVSAAAKSAAAAAVPESDPDLHWSSAVNITSLKVPVKQISLHNAAFDHEADIYLCSGSSEACQVEMAGTAFQDALNASPMTVEMGQYDYVFVKTCEDSEGEYRTAITGTVTLDGQLWKTKTTGVLGTDGSAEPLSITANGCGRTYALPHPLRITDSLGAQVDFKLYFDIQDLAYAALGSSKTARAWTPGNCAGDRPAEGTDAASPPFVCIGYPDVSGIIDAAPAVLERYRLNDAATMGLFFTAGDDLPIGGYFRQFFTEGVRADPGFEAVMPVRDLVKNSDGTVLVSSFGDNGNAYDPAHSVFKAEHFRRATHSGTFSSTSPFYLGSAIPYSAERLAR